MGAHSVERRPKMDCGADLSTPWTDNTYITCVCVHNYCHHHHYYHYYQFDSLDRQYLTCVCVSTIIVIISVINYAAGTMSKTTEVIITITIKIRTI